MEKNNMKLIIKLEEAAMFLFCIYLLRNSPWWVYPILILGPDISMLGYLVNEKIGAFCYNVIHHKGIAIALILSGMILDPMNIYLTTTGIILFGHSSMDRMVGYGLKYSTSFKHTHLGKIGK